MVSANVVFDVCSTNQAWMKGGLYEGDFLCFLVFSVEICVYSPVEVFTKGTKHLLMKPGRGRQCAFMALNSILYGQISPVTSWSSKMVDTILTAADDMHVLGQRFADNISLMQLHFRRVICPPE